MKRNFLLLGYISVIALTTAILLSSCITPPDAITTGKQPVINPDEVVPEVSAADQQSTKPLSMWERLQQLFKKPDPAPAPTPSPVPPSPSVTTIEPPGTIAPPAAVIEPAPAPAAEVQIPAPEVRPDAAPALTEARDLNGIWTGNGVYYQLDMVSGERVRKITVEISAKIEQNGTDAAMEMDFRAVKWEPQEPVKEAGWWVKELKDVNSSYTIMRYLNDPIPEGYVESKRWRVDLSVGEGDGGDTWTRWLTGSVSATTLLLDMQSAGAFTGGFEKWEFTFTTDLMSGGVTSIPGEVIGGTYYKGRESDPKAFVLTRQK